MFKKIMQVLAGLFILALLIGNILWLISPSAENPPDVSDSFEGGFDNWPSRFVDALGKVEVPPNHGADVRMENGEMRLEISPDPDFANESFDQIPGGAAPETYNNAFAIGMQGYSANSREKETVEFRMKVDEGYEGTTGLWLEAQDTFGSNGYMVPGGFPGAFGLSFTSADSWWPISGLKFEYVKGWVPLCIGSVDVDPFVWNTYRIEWSKGFLYDRFKIFANGQYQGGCIIPFIGFQKSEIQLWADNYLVKEWFEISQLNPAHIQGTNFDDISITVEK